MASLPSILEYIKSLKNKGDLTKLQRGKKN